MPDTNHRAPITTHGYRCAGKPAIHHAHAGHGPDEFDRPSCGVPVVPDESERPLCGVPVMPDESDRPSCGMPVVPDESDRPSCGVPVSVSRVPCGTSPGRCPSCRASPVPTRVLVDARRAGRVPCGNESRSIPVICHAPAQHTPVADAANRCVACGFTCQYRGVLSTPVRRRGSGGSLGRPQPQNAHPEQAYIICAILRIPVVVDSDIQQGG